MKTPDALTALQDLRTRAERRRLVTENLQPDAPAADMQRLVQELQVHQIELEMQYEELLVAQADAEGSRLQYLDLYDFAPVGYCTLHADGALHQLNLRMGQLLGQVRQQLVGRRLALFVAPAERHQFAEFLARLWASPGQRYTCELAMRRADDTAFFAQVEGVAAPEGLAPTGGPALGHLGESPPVIYRLVLLDITQRRRAADELAAREARFRAAFEQSTDGMVLLEDHRFVSLNAAALGLLGQPDARQVVGHSLAEFWPERQPDGRRSLDVLSACLEQARRQGWCRLEWQRFDAAGQPVWDELSFNPMLIEGQPLLHAAWRDVTERKRNEQRLRESERRLQLALASSSAGLWTWDLATDQLELDASAQAIFAQPQAHLPFAAVLASLHPHHPAPVQQQLAQARQAHRSFDFEHRLVRPDGRVVYVAASGQFVYQAPGGQPQYLVGLVRDVTSRHEAQQELSYKNRLLGNILENMPVLLCRLGPGGEYRELVGSGLRRLGLTDNELLGSSAADQFPADAAHIRRLLAGKSATYTMRVEHAGRAVYFQAYGFFDPVQQEGVIFAIDITESEHLKEDATRVKLRQQQEVLSAILTTQEEERRRIAEALHNGLGQLLYGTRLHLDALPASEAVRASQELINEAIRTTRTISFELTPGILEDFGLTVALEELVKRIPRKQLFIDLNLSGLDAPLPPMLQTAVYRIVQELLNNVMKYAQAQEVFVQVSREAGHLHVSVEDDGVGFDPDSPVRRNGIGLAGIRTRVGLLGGTLTLRSRAGQGTGVSFALPVPESS